MSKPYTDAQKAEAVDLYVEHGTAEAARQTGIGTTTIKRWAADDGHTVQTNIKKTEAARAVLASARAEQRERVRILYLDKIEACLTAINPGKPRDAKDLMTTAAIGTDKFRLEMGEATEVVITGDMMDKVMAEWESELGEDPTP
jgi:transposase-like protein